MDAQQALADLTEISSQIRAAVIFDEQGKVAGSTLDDASRAEALAKSAAELLAVADGVKGDGAELAQLEAATSEGSVFVVRQGPTRIAATTGADPTVGLVFYDLKSALRTLETKEDAKPKRPAEKRPVRTSGPGEGDSGEPGGSPATKRAPRKRAAADKKPASEKQPAATTRKRATRKKKDEQDAT